MRIADCGMRIVKEYNFEIRNPKFGWPMIAAQPVLRFEPLPAFHKIFDQLIWG
jgi:hypothetical protein